MWTDGGQSGGNPANGAGVAVFVGDERVRVVGEPLGFCTNNFAEASAVAVGLEILRVPCDVRLFTDSVYVINGVRRLLRNSMLKTNMDAWKRVGYIMRTGRHQFSILEHTYGHGDDEINNLADAWASWCAASQKHIDRVYNTLAEAMSDAPKPKNRPRKNRR
jgi:ribonuclease HI